jgi:hypothetical protein
MSDAAITTAKAVEKKSWVDSWAERIRSDVKRAVPVKAKPYTEETGSVVRSYVTAAVVAPLLGAADARFGLDAPGFPIDGGLAALGAAVAIGTAGSYPGVSQDARLAGTLAFASLLQRRTKAFLGGRPGGDSSRLHGGASEGGFKAVGPKNGASADLAGDPIVRGAEHIFRRKEAQPR